MSQPPFLKMLKLHNRAMGLERALMHGCPVCGKFLHVLKPYQEDCRAGTVDVRVYCRACDVRGCVRVHGTVARMRWDLAERMRLAAVAVELMR